MSDPSDDAAVPERDHEPDEQDWAAEIERLRAARAERLAERLAEPGTKEPPIRSE